MSLKMLKELMKKYDIKNLTYKEFIKLMKETKEI